ncbi:conserved hypothetical protein [Mycobacterium ulcerans Agy99]|nr:conserved hypothetical protein [Mycobacterium ulcerans Agy99]EPQ74988.1 hypothetical protein MMEU_2648 [Mycobacterium marinum str. Europe]
MTMAGHPDVERPASPKGVATGEGGIRLFDGRRWTVESPHETHDITVCIRGMQYADGRVVSRVAVGGLLPDQPLTAHRARGLARALIAAADAADGPDAVSPNL